jgi:hypothetical protein
MTTGMEAKETGVECRSGGGEGAEGGQFLRARILGN